MIDSHVGGAFYIGKKNGIDRNNVGSGRKIRELVMEELYVKLYEQMRKPDLALEHLQNRVNMIDDGKDSIQRVPLYHTMAKFHDMKGEDSEAEKALECYIQAHSIIIKRYGETSLQTAKSSFMIAMKLLASETADEVAESYLKDSIEAYKSIVGEDDVRTRNGIEEMAKIMMRKAEIQQALDLMHQISVYKSTNHDYINSPSQISPYDKHYCSSLKRMAACYLALNQQNIAIKIFKQCLLIERVIYPARHHEANMTQQHLRILLHHNKKNKK